MTGLQSRRAPEPAFDVPILWLVYNRPDKSAEVFQAIRRARPAQLFVVADGPRTDRPNDVRLCAEVREIVESGVDWECRVAMQLRPQNIGCRRSVSAGIDWFFQHVKEGIILEDDTLPAADFFPYCRELLARYRNDPRVMHIGGNNFHFGRRRGGASYYASKFAYIWGWATWRRAWQCYDVSLAAFPEGWHRIRKKWLTNLEEHRFWKDIFVRVQAGEFDTWDYQWTYALLARQGISLLPNRNLVSNIGFGDTAASHTTDAESLLSRIPLEPQGRIVHPPQLEVDHAADSFVFQHLVLGRPMPRITFRQRLANLRWLLRNR